MPALDFERAHEPADRAEALTSDFQPFSISEKSEGGAHNAGRVVAITD